MDVTTSPLALAAQDADTIALPLFDGETPPEGAPRALAELIDAGEARGSFRSLALAHAEATMAARRIGGAQRVLSRASSRGRRDRARANPRAGLRALCWALPSDADAPIAVALLEGTMLADYRFDRFKSAPEDLDAPPRQLEQIVIACPDGFADAVRAAAVVVEAVNRARDLQNRPANDLTPARSANTPRR